MPPPAADPPSSDDAASRPPATRGTVPPRSWMARHGAAIAAAATTLILLAAAGAFVPRRSQEAAPPPPAHWFDDRAGMVSPGFAAGKSTYLQQYLPLVLHASVLVVTEPRTPAEPVAEYTARVANAWKIGAQGADNGVVLFVFPDTRTLRLEVGYGLEGALPDIDAGHLVAATLVPQFAQGNYEPGFDDFISGLSDTLKAYAGATERSFNNTGIVEYAWAVLRQAPRALRSVWALFLDSDPTGRVMLTLFAVIFAALFGYALTGAAAGALALVQLPWRIVHGGTLHAIGRDTLAAEFTPSELLRRPPPSLVALAAALDVGSMVWGVLCLSGVVVGLAFLGLGAELFIGEHGQFSGAGVTIVWPPR